MSREMNHKERMLNASQTESLLGSLEIGTLSVQGDDGYPYAVPVNCVWHNKKLYIHTAPYGYKVDCVKNNSKVCFTGILAADIRRAELTANFASVIVTGDAVYLEDDEERLEGLRALISHLSPGFEDKGEDCIKKMFDQTGIIRITPVSITGKAKR